MGRSRILRLSAVSAGLALALTACGGVTSSDEGSGGDKLSNARIMVPNSAGGGYDTTARVAAKVLEDEKITGQLQVFNLEGAGGTVGLARVINEKGNSKLAMQMGLGVVGASYTNDTDASLNDTTPLAKLIEEPESVVVPKDSPYKTIEELVAAWKKDPKSLTVGGGSSPGGPDHLFPMRLADAVGIDPNEVNYVEFDGGGELLPALLGSKIDFGATSASELMDQIDSGELRVLATSGPERQEGVDAPTLQESGIDLAFTNWRGWVAPPGISDADRDAWINALDKMHESEGWKKALESNGWIDAYQTGDDFGTFLKEQDKMVADTLTQLGLA